MRPGAWAAILVGAASCATIAREREAREHPAASAAAATEEEPAFLEPEEVAGQSRAGLQLLQARAVAAELSGAARLRVPEGPRTIGERVPFHVELRNPLARELEILTPRQGLALEISWSVERWLPTGARERLGFRRVALLPDRVLLAPGAVWGQASELVLEAEPAGESLWVVALQARLRCDGARLGAQVLPVEEIEFRRADLLAFPAGWEPLAADPLAELARLAGLGAPELDRHVLVCAALLPQEKRASGIQVLVEGLRAPASARRAATLTAALGFLTDLPFGNSPAAWNAWWEGRRMAEDGTHR